MDIKEKVLLEEHIHLLDQKTLKVRLIMKFSLYVSIASLIAIAIVGIYLLTHSK